MYICISSSYVPLPFLTAPLAICALFLALPAPKTVHLDLPSGHLCPLPGPRPALSPPCVLMPLAPQKKTGMMDTDDFRACLISMGYNMVM